MKYLANAKINLFLKVKGKREDGLHELEMINLPISLCDEIDIVESQRDSIHIDGLNIKETTIHKAVDLMKEEFGFSNHFSINAKKSIPTESGLGGGSSDAAFVIKGISDLLNLENETKKQAIASKIGADVNYFLINKPAIVKGVGEIIEPFELDKDYYILLVFPDKGCSTKEVYALCDSYEHGNIDIKACKEALVKGDEKTLGKLVANDLLPVAASINPEIKTLINKLKELGLSCVSMTGSGSTVFAISQDKNQLIMASENKNICSYRHIICKIIS